MKPQELRVGNRLKLIATGTEIEITSIDRIGLIEYVEVGNPSEEYEDNLGAVEPIPLTEERLSNLGFEEVYRSKFRIKYDCIQNPVFGFDFNLTGQENGMNGLRHYGRYINVEYVHEIQNVYFSIVRQELKKSL